MRKLAALLRLVPLAAAAFASVATSAPPMTTYTIDLATPPPDETAVSPEAVLEIQGLLVKQDGEGPAGLGLRTASGQEIAGTAEYYELEGGAYYRFTPAAPLGPDTYVLYWSGSSAAYWSFEDPEQAALVSRYTDDTTNESVVHFSTVSQPRVRYAHLDTRTGTIRMSFSEDMDTATLDHVKVLDATGDVLPATTSWRGGVMHELELQAPFGAVTLSFEPGLLAKTGVDAAPTPFTIDPDRR